MAPELEVVTGTTFGFDVTWTDHNGNGIDITGCVMKFQIRADDGSVVVAGTTEDGCIVITDATAGAFTVTIPPDQTRRYRSPITEPYFPSPPLRYELRIYFPSGDVYSVLRGSAKLIDGVIHD